MRNKIKNLGAGISIGLFMLACNILPTQNTTNPGTAVNKAAVKSNTGLKIADGGSSSSPVPTIPPIPLPSWKPPASNPPVTGSITGTQTFPNSTYRIDDNFSLPGNITSIDSAAMINVNYFFVRGQLKKRKGQ